MVDAKFLFFENGHFAGQIELGEADGGAGLSETDGVGEFHPGLPFLVIAFEDILVEAIEFRRGIAFIDKVIAESSPAVLGEHIEAWASVETSGAEFEFTAFDLPFLPADFDAGGECIADGSIPIEDDFGLSGEIGGSDQATVASGKAHEVA